MPVPAAAAPLRFGRFELQAHERRLLVDGVPAALGARAFDLLLALAERPGRLLSKRVLFELVWPGLVVQENNLAAQVSALRKVVGDDVIATIPGRGYRFVARIDNEPAAAPVPLAAPPSALPTHLPAELTALLGRQDELSGLLATVDAQRLVTIVGPGGVGKSLLAQHLLRARQSSYPQGVCWVELAAVLEVTQLPGAIVGALGLHGTGGGDPVQSLLHALAPLSMLLALDNAEHLLADVATLCHALHARCPRLRIVVTSQAPLKLAAERVVRIEPLAVPDGPVPAQQALQFGAVALFVQRVQAIDARFELRDDNAAPAIELCRALDGLPMAIELAAARVPLLGVAPLLASMSQRLQLLSTSRNRAAPLRQSTLRAALDWSHDLLEAREQQVFRRLGVIVGSAALALIQPVVADATLDAWAVLDALDVLVDRSLVAVLPPADARGALRYRLLESPRTYALERLADSAEQETLRQRHALAMAALCDGAYARYFSGAIGADAWGEEIAPDFDNARDALAWARATDDARSELTIAATLLRALPPSLHAERMALADACEARLARADGIADALRERVCIELACAWADTQKGRARDAAARALELARRLDVASTDRFALYHALSRAASAAAQVGDLVTAQAALTELRALEDPAWPPQRLLWGAEAAQVVARLS
ncbi:MAG TPA: winged helix-turn-helix domain-containing protein, partial [Burkholderiaceae bacterium]|nr:winged helix-turn-helix domain-containing protein [Burkholderiaceae bacterium]